MELEETADATTLCYWLNWRVLLCAIWVLTSTVLALLMMWKYERLNNHIKSDSRDTYQDGLNQPLCESEAWRPCLKTNPPRLVARFSTFCFPLTFGNVYFQSYHQWRLHTSLLHSCGSLLSAYGCYQHINLSRSSVSDVEIDAEQGSYMALISEEAKNGVRKRSISNPQEENSVYQLPGIWNYVFEIIFQMNAGAVMLTNSIYWFIIFPFLTVRDYNLTFESICSMTIDVHTVNVIILLSETALNCLRVPFFRISFFILWTGAFVIFQWIIHACVSIWWPYPFLDLASPYSPLWYFLIGVMHIPCYGIFALIVEKPYFLAKRFPSSSPC